MVRPDRSLAAPASTTTSGVTTPTATTTNSTGTSLPSEGDNVARLQVRSREVEESARIVEQCVDRLEGWADDDREIQANVPRTLKLERGRETYRAVEGAKGELGIYIRSDGTEKPARFEIRAPSFSHLSTLDEMAEGEYVPDLVATLGSLDTIMGEVDR